MTFPLLEIVTFIPLITLPFESTTFAAAPETFTFFGRDVEIVDFFGIGTGLGCTVEGLGDGLTKGFGVGVGVIAGDDEGVGEADALALALGDGDALALGDGDGDGEARTGAPPPPPPPPPPLLLLLLLP
jgi:hypothetical protein